MGDMMVDRIIRRSRPAWRGLSLASGALSCSVLAATAAWGQAAPGQAPPAQPTAVGEVVVTASKRAETLKNVPTAITALTSTTLKTLGIDQAADYIRYVPSLEINDAGVAGHGTLIIRGVDSGWEQTTPTVGFYIDNTPFTPSSASSVGSLVMPDPDLADVDRIEVLKGPQATLYGASTLGGLVKIVTKRPDLRQFSGDIQVDGVAVDGGGEGGGVHASANIPVIPGELALRISGFDRFDPGYVDNVLTGDKDVNGTRVYGGRIALRFDPTDRLDIQLNAFLQNLRASGTAQEDLDINTLKPIEGYDEYSAYFDPKLASDYRIYSLDASYRFDLGTLTNTTSYAQYDDDEVYDYTNSYGPLLGLYGVTDPNGAMLGHLIPQMRKVSEELRFNSNRVGPIEWQAGLFYTHEDVSYDAILHGVDGPTGAPLPAPYYDFINALTKATYDEYAAYGDVTWHFTDTLDATAGVRYSGNVQHADAIGSGLLNGGVTTNNPSSSSDTDVSYLFNVRWRPTTAISLYARAASAYRPGGPQFSPSPGVPSSFGPDTVWSYEGGIKGDWLDHRLSIDADVYYVDWRNIQLNALVDGLTVTGNGGDAHTEGVEFESKFAPIKGLLLGANLAYDQSRIDSISASSTAGAVVGDPLPYTPKWSGSLTADYSFPLIGSATGGLGASYQYQGKRPSSFTDDELNSKVEIPAYSVVDLRARVDWSRYSVVFRVDNVAGDRGLSGVAISRVFPGQVMPATGVPIQPRTFRLSLEARF